MTVWDPVQAQQGVALAQECLRSFAEVGALVVPEDTGPPTFRGLRCIRDVVANEVLLRVPIAHCINVDRARREIQVDVPLLAQAQTLTGQDVLCLWLIFERAKGPLSTYAALTASLPVECSEMSAAFWPEDRVFFVFHHQTHMRAHTHTRELTQSQLERWQTGTPTEARVHTLVDSRTQASSSSSGSVAEINLEALRHFLSAHAASETC